MTSPSEDQDYIERLENAIKWTLDIAGRHLGIYKAFSDMQGDAVVRTYWHCRGCNGEFVSKDFVPYVGYGDDPNDKTFPHEQGCKYLLLKNYANNPA